MKKMFLILALSFPMFAAADSIEVNVIPAAHDPVMPVATNVISCRLYPFPWIFSSEPVKAIGSAAAEQYQTDIQSIDVTYGEVAASLPKGDDSSASYNQMQLIKIQSYAVALELFYEKLETDCVGVCKVHCVHR